MDKKTISWIIFAVLALVAAVLAVRAMTGGAKSEIQDLAASVTIRYEDTGDETQMNRGIFERALLARLHQSAPIDASIGLTNPKTGKPTGFPKDRELWNAAIEDLKRTAAELKKK
ncbi:MAG: hypothetical protein JNK58_02505 [Phycisphaerae bacterium]|nr:hypothetical protein [Phycisphaerae bacterium]